MLSTKDLSNVSEASHYFMAKDNYYSEEEGIAASRWWGKGAKRLSLFGEVDQQRFEELLSGKISESQYIGKIVDGKREHRPGWDLTFSAPKSVSVLSILGKDERLLKAHQDAVNVALSQVERDCAEARVQVNGEMTYQATGNITASLFHHDVSRALDPQLHTHCVVFNLTERQDGKWRSLSSQLKNYGVDAQGAVHGFIEQVRHDKRYYGQLYRNELAYLVKELGYTLVVDHKKGFFEIEGVPKDILTAFSERREDIQSYLDKHQLSGGKAASIATLNTRQSKQQVDRHLLQEVWNKKIEELGFNCEPVIQSSLIPAIEKETVPPLQAAVKAIRQAVTDISVFESTFRMEQLITRAGEYVIGDAVSASDLLRALDQECHSGELITLSDNASLLMSKKTVDDEKQILLQANQLALARPLVDKTRLSHYLLQHPEAPNDLKKLFNTEPIMAIEGNSRSSLVTSLVSAANALGVETQVLSPSLTGSRTLSEQLKEKPLTLWQHLKALFVKDSVQHESVMHYVSRKPNATNKASPSLIVVNQAHLLPTHQMLSLLTLSRTQGNKLILVGEQDKLLPQQAGLPFQQLIQKGIPLLKTKAHLFSVKNSLFPDNVVEVKHADDRAISLAKHYSRLSQRENSLILVQNKDRAEVLNQYTHDVLVEDNRVLSPKNVITYHPVFFSTGKLPVATSYLPDVIIRFNQPLKNTDIVKGEYYRVVGHDQKANTVQLKNNCNENLIFYPDKENLSGGKMECFTEVKRDIGIGESIVFERSIKPLHILKGERYIVKNMTDITLTLKNNSGKSFHIDLSKESHRHFNYGYAVTPHAIVHELPSNLIAECVSYKKNSPQRYLNQIISQTSSAWIYTDDVNVLSKQLERPIGERLTAQEIMEKSQQAKEAIHSMLGTLEKYLPEHSTSNAKSSMQALEYAIQHSVERDAGFTQTAIFETAMRYAMGKVNQSQLANMLNAYQERGDLLKGKQMEGRLWTTLETVKMEREILCLSTQDKNTLPPIAEIESIESHKACHGLNQEQVSTLALIHQTHHRVIAIQGYPGTGKTTLLVAAQTILNEHGYTVRSIAPTHQAAEELSKRGIPSETLENFLRSPLSTEINRSEAKIVLVLDEASMVSNRQMVQLLERVHQEKCRLVVMGDTRQFPSIEAGKPQTLMQATVDTAYLIDIQRQRNPLLKQAVKETLDYDVRRAFETLDKSIITINKDTVANAAKTIAQAVSDSQEKFFRIETMVDKLMSYPKEVRDNILLYTPGRDDRAIANNKVRARYQQDGTLTGIEHTFSVLTSRSLTRAECSHAGNIHIGDVLRFSMNSSAGIKAGEYLTVMGCDLSYQLLTLQNEDGRVLHWQLPSLKAKNPIEVFTREERGIQIGDEIRWTRSDKKRNLTGSTHMRVIDVSQQQVITIDKNKNTLTFDAKDMCFQHWDYSYASTGYGAQGKTKPIVLALMESYRTHLTNMTSFLVAMTRAVDEFFIYTDNKEALMNAIFSRQGTKYSGLEIIGEFKNADKSTLKNDTILPKINTQKKSLVPSFDQAAMQKIREGLANNAEAITISLLGDPVSRMGGTLRFGTNKGSLVVTISGPKQGMWYDFSPEKTLKGKCGGDMLSLIQLQKNITYREALSFAADWLAMPKELSQKVNLIKPSTLVKLDDKANTRFAEQLAKESIPIKGTIAERYLKMHRKIDMENYPSDFRFHPGIYSKLNNKTLPALLVIARDRHHNIQAVQAIYLDKDTVNKIDKTQVNLQKQTFGKIAGNTVKISGTENGRILIAEGPETGLSLAKAFPEATVHITLGKSNFLHVDIPIKSNITLCLDNDGKAIKEDATIFTATKRLADQGHSVRIALPGGTSKQDYNDMIKEGGISKINDSVTYAEDFEKFYSAGQPATEKHLVKNEVVLPKTSKVLHKKELETFL